MFLKCLFLAVFARGVEVQLASLAAKLVEDVGGPVGLLQQADTTLQGNMDAVARVLRGVEMCEVQPKTRFYFTKVEEELRKRLKVPEERTLFENALVNLKSNPEVVGVGSLYAPPLLTDDRLSELLPNESEMAHMGLNPYSLDARRRLVLGLWEAHRLLGDWGQDPAGGNWEHRALARSRRDAQLEYAILIAKTQLGNSALQLNGFFAPSLAPLSFLALSLLYNGSRVKQEAWVTLGRAAQQLQEALSFERALKGHWQLTPGPDASPGYSPFAGGGSQAEILASSSSVGLHQLSAPIPSRFGSVGSEVVRRAADAVKSVFLLDSAPLSLDHVHEALGSFILAQAREVYPRQREEWLRSLSPRRLETLLGEAQSLRNSVEDRLQVACRLPGPGSTLAWRDVSRSPRRNREKKSNEEQLMAKLALAQARELQLEERVAAMPGTWCVELDCEKARKGAESVMDENIRMSVLLHLSSSSG